MTSDGVIELYTWLSVAWPMVVNPNASEEWRRAKLKDLFRTYKDYEDIDVIEAFHKWTDENEKAPTTKGILNEIKWMRLARRKNHENEELWDMNFIKKDGTEWSYGSFKRSDFIDHPKNPEHLEPEEWERRYKHTRNRVLGKMYTDLYGKEIDHDLMRQMAKAKFAEIEEARRENAQATVL